MAEKTLEIRGIPLSQICTYLAELGGLQQSDGLAFQFLGGGWSGEIQSEEEVQITSRFFVNAIHIHFTASSESLLDDLIIKFRKKTMRIGG